MWRLKKSIVYFTYQFNLNENLILKQKDSYEYDVGIINATPVKSDTVNNNLTYKITSAKNSGYKIKTI